MRRLSPHKARTGCAAETQNERESFSQLPPRANRLQTGAISRASEAAAALISANDKLAAAAILADVSRSKTKGKGASAALLQAAYLYATNDPPATANAIETILRDVLSTWPESAESDRARDWLIKILKSQKRWVDAAKFATTWTPAKVTQPRMTTANVLWIEAVLLSDADDVHQLGLTFIDAYKELVTTSPIASQAFRAAAAVVLDPNLLDHALELDAGEDGFPEQLLSYRHSDGGTGLPEPLNEWLEPTIWRLMRDGRIDRKVRKRNAQLIQSWQAGKTANIGQIERLIWLGEIDRAVAVARRLADESKSAGKTLTDAARLLTAGETPQAKASAIAMWDQIAAGIPKGTPQWHDAKLQSIRLLAATDRKEDAVKRARFVLITSPPKDAAVRKQYESLIR